MPTINLDDALPEDITVVIHDVDYKLPADIPIPDYVAIVKAAEAFDEAGADDSLEAADALYHKVLALFQVRDPALEKVPLGVGQLVKLITSIYGGDYDQDPPKPQETTTPGATTRPRKPKAKKSGSTSS